MRALLAMYKTELTIAIALVVLIAIASGCSTFAPVPQPPIKTDADAFATIYSDLATAYDSIIAANTPVAEGSKPLLSTEQGLQLKKRLDHFKQTVDAAYAAMVVGGGYENPASLAATLRALRAQIPE